MKGGKIINKLSQRVLRFGEILVCVLLALLVLDVLWGVFTRFVLGRQSRWSEEVAIYLLIWVSLLGAAVTYAEQGHLGVDYLVQKFESRIRSLATYFSHLVVLIFASYGMFYGGWQLVFEAVRSGQVSSAMGIPLLYVYLAVPLSGFMICFFAINTLMTPVSVDIEEIQQ